MVLQNLGTAPKYLKAGFVGFEKSGKTTTATKLAIGVRNYLGLKGPIGYFDTESGSSYVSTYIKRETGMDPVGVKSRSLKDLLEMTEQCVKEGISVLIVDSITHPSDELIAAYMRSVNAARATKNLPPRKNLEMQDYAQIAASWAPWTTMYLNSPLHIIVCGRASFEWDREENEESGKKELVKTGIKMRAAKQFGYEPSLLIEMEQIKTQTKQGLSIVHEATVLADRFIESELTGKQCNDPGIEFFIPHIKLLKNGTHTPVDMSVKTDVNADEAGDVEWNREKRSRTILSEEIQGILVAHIPGMDAESKKRKADLIFKYCNTRSWTAVEGMQSDLLREALKGIRAELEPKPVEAPPADGAIFGNDGAQLASPVVPPVTPAESKAAEPAKTSPAPSNPMKDVVLTAIDAYLKMVPGNGSAGKKRTAILKKAYEVSSPDDLNALDIKALKEGLSIVEAEVELALLKIDAKKSASEQVLALH